ncbi:ABC transporter ATP-binding protein [Allosediminivita pacifica]|uniref:Nickel import system ATP-binding protein NikD n=1 Tax=Allosediminivita pacifica TaxID=1267769 RepID=A0A2T6ATT5_9RHOB|nr:ABC transporter ATP-binding protein [Allosediminivita pacifica]PTX47229.1 peptide/nickel transport system ATP-binding protein/dipeptide transport system ATP-binding protein [Allosediminivita pacifica]GGB09256.1 ABC transporter ATP-binding protein [Allosediminivita pacifica]
MTYQDKTDTTEAQAVAAPVLELEGITVAYPRYGESDHVALDAVDLKIRRGEIVGLVGETGAGKTLLTRTVMGAIPGGGEHTSGAMRYNGTPFTDLPDDKSPVRPAKDIALIVSNPRRELNPVLTVGQQIVNVIRHHLGLSEKEARARAVDMLRAVAIPDPESRMDAWPHELSGGMAQRVVIAIALSCDPGLVISDDATSALDVTVQLQVLNLMKEMVAGSETAALIITRDIAITAHYCDRVVILYKGEVVEEAPRDAFFDRPHHPYSINLLAAFAHSPALREAWWDVPPLADGTRPACRFADRCARRQPRCVSEAPALRDCGAGRRVRCHYPVEAGT